MKSNCPNRLPIFLLIAAAFIASLVFVPKPLHAFSRSQYFDFGPYYSPIGQVLGFSFSSLEHLPSLVLPEGIKLASAAGILPDSPLYPFEKAIEQVQLTFTFDPVQKEQLRLDIASERLSEAQTLTAAGKTDAASSAIAGYQQTMTDLSENLPKLAESGTDSAKNMVDKVEETAVAHAVIAQNLVFSLPPVQAEGWVEVVDIGKKALDQAAAAKGQPPIPDSLSAGIQQLKEQGLITSEESNKLYGLPDRSSVREEMEKLVSSGQFPLAEIAKLDSAIETRFPQVYNQTIDNLRYVELKNYETLSGPTPEILSQIDRWQGGKNVPPPAEIRPYLYHLRAQEIAQTLDLGRFTPEQQAELTKSYSGEIQDNPTYSPPASPPPTLAPDQTTAQPSATDQTSSPSATAQAPAPSPTPIPLPVGDYLVAASSPLPGDPTYFTKQLTEQFRLFTTFDPAKRGEYRLHLAEERLSEAQSLSENKDKTAVYEATLKRYQQEVVAVSDYVKDYSGTKSEGRELAKKLETQAARHEAVFETGFLPPPAQNPELISQVIKATENAMDKSADVLERPPLPKALSDRLQDLKAQGLIMEEEVNDLTQAPSREEVREKVRALIEAGSFPLAEAKRLDEAQSLAVPSKYNQLVEVRKVEELQGLRAVQREFAQTPSFRATAAGLSQRLNNLSYTIDLRALRIEDFAGREDLIKTFEALSATASARPINAGQFGPEATPGARFVAPPGSADAVLSTCPVGATFKQSEGCVWADSGRAIYDWEQYKCAGPGQYYSFAGKKCLTSDPGSGFKEDGQPICPVGYSWSWQRRSCEGSSIGGIIPFPSPKPEPKPENEQEIAERSKSCPAGSSYKVPQGCVWDKDNEPVYNSSKYRCGTGEYYSFEKLICVSLPKAGETYPKDTTPSCKDNGSVWSWSEGKCTPIPQEVPPSTELAILKPTFVSPGNPFYFLKQAGEAVQRATAFTPQARAQVSLSQAEERLAEAFDALKKNDDEKVKKAISSYTSMMQDIVADVSKESLTEGAKKQIADRLAKESVDHSLLLQKLSALATEAQDTAINAAVSATILGVDKAADIAGEPPIPPDVKAKIEALPKDMISEEDKKKLLEAGSRVEARLALGGLATSGILTQADTAFLNEDFTKVDQAAKIKLDELKSLDELASLGKQKDELNERVSKNEEIVKKLDEFQKTFEVGGEIPTEVRPYVRLTRIDEVAQTIRPDTVNLSDFANRKDIQLAVATLQQEYKPTREAFGRVEDFRRRNPNQFLPPELARIEALSYSLGVRDQAGPCFLPTPPFAPNTPCPAPGAAIPITSTWYGVPRIGDPIGFKDDKPGVADWDFPVYRGGSGYTDKDGNPLVYGQGPKPEKPGICSDGYHWMYDSGGWCMSNSGNYSSPTPYGYGGPTGPGYTPYSPYYTAPGVPPVSYGYPGPGTYVYPGPYSPPSYWGPAPTNYTTDPPPGTVPGSGPAPTAPGQCPSGYHWMSDSGGWCMANGNTYVPGGGGGYYGGPNQPSPNLTKESCGPGYYWSGNACYPNNSPGGGGGGGTPWCWTAFPPPGGWNCESGSSWDGSSCSCKPNSSTPYATPWGTPGTCQAPSGGCGINSYWDSGTCSCREILGRPQYYPPSCYPPSGGCPGGWYDYSSCSCKTSSTPGPGTTPSSSGYCPAGSHWMSDNGGYCMSDGGSTSTSTSSTPSTSTSSGSCPGGYHWMSDNGGWCMQDGGGSTTSSGGSTTTTTSEPAPSTTTTTTTSEPAPAPSTTTSQPAPAPSEPAPAPPPSP